MEWKLRLWTAAAFVLLANIGGTMSFSWMVTEIWTYNFFADLVFVASMTGTWLFVTSKHGQFWMTAPLVLLGYLVSFAMTDASNFWGIAFDFSASSTVLQYGWGGIILTTGAAYMANWSATGADEVDLDQYDVRNAE